MPGVVCAQEEGEGSQAQADQGVLQEAQQVIRDNAAAARDADLVLNLVNNGWFGDCYEERQMVAIWKFRAVETGVPFLSCANGGISCVIAPNGETTAILDRILERGVLSAPVPKAWERPLYGRGGRWILPGALALLCLSIFLLGRRKKSERSGI